MNLLPPNVLNRLMGRPAGSKQQEFHTVQQKNKVQHAGLSSLSAVTLPVCIMH